MYSNIKQQRSTMQNHNYFCTNIILPQGSNQSNLKEISPGISLEGMMLKLKLQYFGHLMWSTDSLEKTLNLGGIWCRRRRGRQRMRWLDGITDSMDSEWTPGVGDGTGRPGVLQFMGSQSQTQLSEWTELNWILPPHNFPCCAFFHVCLLLLENILPVSY